MYFDKDFVCLVLYRREKKTANHTPMPLFSDAQNFKFDIFHSLACLLVMWQNTQFLFPSLGGKIDTATRTIGKYLPVISLSNPEFGDLKGTGIRSGAANCLASIDGVKLHSSWRKSFEWMENYQTESFSTKTDVSQFDWRKNRELKDWYMNFFSSQRTSFSEKSYTVWRIYYLLPL